MGVRTPDVGPIQLIVLYVQLALRALLDVYVNGHAFDAFWGAFSWVDFPVRFGSDGLTFATRGILAAGTVTTACAVVAGYFTLAVRVRRVADDRSVLTAARLATRDIAGGTYFVFTAIAIAIFIMGGGISGLQGRYWLPVILPTFLFPVVYATFIVPRRFRRKVRLAVACVLALYSCVASPYAIASIDRRFYAATVPPPNKTWTATFRDVRSANGAPLGTNDPIVLRGIDVKVSGYALDYRTGLPGRSLDLLIDGRRLVHARYGEPRADIAAILHDAATQRSGFSATVATAALAPGTHTISMVLYPVDSRASSLGSVARLELTVVSAHTNSR